MWVILKTDHYSRRYKRYAKKKSLELAAVLNNLDIFLKSLHSGKPPKPLIYGFLHPEPNGVIAVDQTGGVKLAATRLYVYPVTETETLYLLTLGDKASQGADIQDCKAFVKQIKANPNAGDTEDDGGDDEHAQNQEEGGG